MEVQQGLMKQGTTSFLMCLATNIIELFMQAIDVFVKHRDQLTNCLGLHLEGSYLNPVKRGAHIKKASLDEVKALVERADGLLKMMTIAPECQCDKLIQYLLDQHVVLSIGYSDANFEKATLAYN